MEVESPHSSPETPLKVEPEENNPSIPNIRQLFLKQKMFFIPCQKVRELFYGSETEECDKFWNFFTRDLGQDCQKARFKTFFSYILIKTGLL